MTPALILYGTDGCHLCHDAQALLRAHGLAWQDIDIVDDDALYQRYGIRIPVLQRGDSQAELNWPFGSAQLAEFLRS